MRKRYQSFDKDEKVKIAAVKYRRIKEINTVRNDFIETLIFEKNENILPTLNQWMFCFGFVFKFLNNAGIFIVSAFLQFLTYGLILDWFRAKDGFKWGLLFVIVLHTILVVLTLKFFQ